MDTSDPTINLAPGLAVEMTTEESTLEVSGSVSDLTGVTVKIWVNYRLVATTWGTFSELVDLSLGPNEIVIIAEDEAGNSSSRTIYVTRSVPAGGAVEEKKVSPPEESMFWVIIVVVIVAAAAVIAIWKRPK